MAETKDELPVTAWRCDYIDPEDGSPALVISEDKIEGVGISTPLTSHAAAQSRINALLEEVEKHKKDAERLEYIFSCDFLAARAYLPDLNANDFIAKRKARIDEEIARRASLSSGRSGSGDGGMG